MTDLFYEYEPKETLHYFTEISQIPRGSGEEKAISDYLVSFAANRGLEVFQDAYNNVLIKKEASPGYEDAPIVILQGHMDMVWEKNKDVEHDFLTQGIKLRIVDGHIYAENTTLGADNGIAVAMALALLDSKNISHPRIEAVFTVEEETGLTGATNFDGSKLSGRYLINLDSEDDAEIMVSCAGGIRIHHEVDLQYMSAPKNSLFYNISITGLKGGHSGMDINLNRANANKLLARILYDIKRAKKMHLVDIWGGSKDNAIPREAEATIVVCDSVQEIFESAMKRFQELFGEEYATSDPNISINVSLIDNCERCLTKETTEKIINLLMILPNGVQTMSADMKDLVESSINTAVLAIKGDILDVTSSARSSVNSKKDTIVEICQCIADALKIEMNTNSAYPGWALDNDSKLRDQAIDSYFKLFGTEPKIVATHAGVECGIFKEKISDLDMISIGPNMYDVHTPNEHVSIASIEKSWQWLLEILRTIE